MLKHIWFDITGTLTTEKQAAPVLDALRKHVPISVFSNYSRASLLQVLQDLNIPLAYFTHSISSDDTPAAKPALDGFYKMIELSGVPAEQIMYVGDLVSVDITPAKKLGIVTCLIYSQSSEPDFCVQSFAELETLINKQCAK